MHRHQERLIVVGNGMVGYKFLECLRESRGGERFEVRVFGEEEVPAYDRVHLSEFFRHKTPERLLLQPREWYERNGIRLHLKERVIAIDPSHKAVITEKRKAYPFDLLVLATGSSPFLPPLPGVELPGIYLYRTLRDLQRLEELKPASRIGVLGGGLLGLEAAQALKNLGHEVIVVEMLPWLMARQLDSLGGGLLRELLKKAGIPSLVGKKTRAIEKGKEGLLLTFEDGEPLPLDAVVISAGIRPRDELARGCGLTLGPRGGFLVDEKLRTNHPRIYALGECACPNGNLYGLVAPGNRMAEILAENLTLPGERKSFTTPDLSTTLKFQGIEVATIGDPVGAQNLEGLVITTLYDELAGVYKKLFLEERTRTLKAAILVGSTREYPRLHRMYREGEPLPPEPMGVITGKPFSQETGEAGDTLICTCNHVLASELRDAIAQGARTYPELSKKTGCGSGCGGCKPRVQELLNAELKRLGIPVQKRICEHFPYTRRELYEIVKIKRLRTFSEVIRTAGNGLGCEICKPVVASILASLHGETACTDPYIQDTNDRFLANLQRGGTYSIVPRIPGGEITPDKLIALGTIAKKYNLYCKITGGQRIDLFGAPLDKLPEIWEELIAAGFESGHAYAKGMRTVKSCVGSPWCRFGVLDSTAFAIRLEHRYKGLRAPHKLKAAVSGCLRECAEARSKDFGVIATERGWNLYVCGNGGVEPKHAQLLAEGLDDETCIRYIDRFLMYYIKTADPLTRTSKWLEGLEGGIEYLRRVIVEDHLGIASELEREMEEIVSRYRCEWREVVEDPEKRKRFRTFVNSNEPDPAITFVYERGQKRPANGGGLVALERIRRLSHSSPKPHDPNHPKAMQESGI